MEWWMSVGLGLGLAAACGFRVFVPLLVASIAAQTGYLELSGSFGWIGSPVALVTFAAATGLEILAYYVPWFDNLLDTVATPASVIAGILVSASVFTDMNPLLSWTLAVVAGGGSAGFVQAATGFTRMASTAVTGGLGNPVVSTLEAIFSFFLSALALFAPLLAAFAVLAGMAWLARRWMVRRALPASS